MKSLILLAIIFSFTNFQRSSLLQNSKYHNFKDSTELSEFKAFTRQFFNAVKKRDTNFLIQHIKFPIRTGSFETYDGGLEGKSSIPSQVFFKKLKTIFPNDVLIDLPKAEYQILKHAGMGTEYIVTIYGGEGGVDSNVNWFFVRKKNQFYFELFTAEAG
jgi:hypothetical protein